VIDVPPDGEWLRTSLGHSTPTSITVRDRDIQDLMGGMSFSHLAFLLASGRVPSDGEATVFDAILVSLADHGLTPMALAARLTYTGAPEAIQGAIASGLLGSGSVFLGPVEDTGRFLDDILVRLPSEHSADEEALEAAAADAVRAALRAGRRIPGLGHPIHKETDPRVPRLYQLAQDNGLVGPHMRLLELVAVAQRSQSDKPLPINGAGAAGAALADLGFPPSLARGFALLARTAGLIGHLAEESDSPIAMRLWKEVEGRAGAAGESGSDPPS
jgi:citrate synthase